jgi:hypothetical protein
VLKKIDRLDRLYGLHLAVVGSWLGLLVSPRGCEGAKSMAPLSDSEFDEVVVGGGEHVPLL